MNNFYCKFYSLSCLLLLFSNQLLAERLDLPPITSCTFNVPQEQQAFMLDRCLVAAKGGDKDAQYQLGLYYAEGKLVAADYAEALYWLKQASSQAHVPAQVKLANMYFKGQGISVDNLQAYVIFKIAGINGSNRAMDKAELVSERMTPQELQQANCILGKTFQHYLKNMRENSSSL